MIQLVEAVNAELLDFAPDHIRPKKAVYRIYRDTRFSADKTPYKTHIALFSRITTWKTILSRVLFSSHRKVGWHCRRVLHAGTR